MASQTKGNDVKETKPSFFTSLRRLERDVEDGVKSLQGKLDGRNLQHINASDRHIALKGMLDRKKDIGELKKEARSFLKDFRQKGEDFESTLKICETVINIKMKELESIHEYLSKYGFVAQQENYKPDAETESESAEGTEGTSTTPPSTPPTSAAAKQEMKKMKMTPRLEDFGLSSYTLNMMSRSQQKKAQVEKPTFKVPGSLAVSAAVGQTSSACGVRATDNRARVNSVPTPFQNRGLSVTPSMFSNSEAAFNTAVRKGGAYEPFTFPSTPAELSGGKQVAMTAAQDFDPCEEREVAPMTLDFNSADSPTPPILHTPGVKQIPHLKDAFHDDKKKVARKLALGNKGAGLDSPVPPVLRTPGIQQIPSSKKMAADKQRGGEGAQRKMDAVSRLRQPQFEMPRTPELTYSLRDLEEMTMSFKNTSLSITACLDDRSASDQDTTSSTASSSSSFATHTSAQKGYKEVLPEPSTAGHHHQNSRQPYSSATSSSSSFSTTHNAAGLQGYKEVLPEPSGHHHQNSRQPYSSATSLPPQHQQKTKAVDVNVPEPKLSSWPRDRYAAESLEAPQTPELTLNYSSMTMKSFADVDVSSHSYNHSVSGFGKYGNYGDKGRNCDEKYSSQVEKNAIEKNQRNVRSEKYGEEKSSASQGCNRTGSEQYSNAFTAYQSSDSCWPQYSKENLQPPCTPELTTRLDCTMAQGKHAEPEQPVLKQRPLAESNLDLPSTPNFMGSYHFMRK